MNFENKNEPFGYVCRYKCITPYLKGLKMKKLFIALLIMLTAVPNAEAYYRGHRNNHRPPVHAVHHNGRPYKYHKSHHNNGAVIAAGVLGVVLGSVIANNNSRPKYQYYPETEVKVVPVKTTVVKEYVSEGYYYY